jgi:hypothetical protein
MKLAQGVSVAGFCLTEQFVPWRLIFRIVVVVPDVH